MVSESLMAASIVIRSPLLEVFDYVANPNNLKEWVPLYSHVSDAEHIVRVSKGDQFRATVSLMPPTLANLLPTEGLLPALTNPQIQVTVDDVVHGRRLAYRANSGWTTICDFEASGDRTILTATQSVWSLPGLVSSYWMGPMQAIANDMQRRTLEGLKRRLEGRKIDPEPQIFFSYRQSDARYVGGRIFDALTAEFGLGTVFRDSKSLLAGGNWGDNIRDAIQQCKVVVVHIGDEWDNIIKKKREAKEPDALVDELEAALEVKRPIRVVPVLTSEDDHVSMYKRMKQIEDNLSLLGKDSQVRKKFTGKLQVQRLREDPDFTRDLERLMRAVWTAFRS
jgi:TIR domain